MLINSMKNIYSNIKVTFDEINVKDLYLELYEHIRDNIMNSFFKIHDYEENGKLCGYELETFTDNIGINQINFLDFRDTFDIRNIHDVLKEYKKYFIEDYSIDENYKMLLNDKSFADEFSDSAGKKMAINDLKKWHKNTISIYKKMESYYNTYKLICKYYDFNDLKLSDL